MLAGAVVGCTSSTIVLPVLQQWKAEKAVKIVLLLESTLGDILGVLTVGFLIRSHGAGGSAVGDFLTGFFSQVAISLVASFLIGFGWSRLLPYLSEQQFWQVLTFSMVLLLYAGTERLGGSGLLAVLGFGLALSNLSGGRRSFVPTSFQLSQGGAGAHEQILNFHAELSFLVRTFFFVLIGAVVQLSGLRPIWPLLLGLTGVIYLARWISIQLLQVDMARTWGIGPRENPLDAASRIDHDCAGDRSGRSSRAIHVLSAAHVFCRDLAHESHPGFRKHLGIEQDGLSGNSRRAEVPSGDCKQRRHLFPTLPLTLVSPGSPTGEASIESASNTGELVDHHARSSIGLS